MKKILITGAGSGLGKELALAYGKEDNIIILVGRNKDKLSNASNELNDCGIKTEIVACDISDYYQVNNLVNYIKENYNNIDYLINNAGVGFFGPIEDLTIREINSMIDINIKGTILLTKGLIPYVNERILNIISTAGLRGKINESVYCASKFAIRGFSESLQKEFYGKKLKITAVYMGGMDTPFWENSDHVKDKSRLKSPSEIAKEIKSKDDGREKIIIEN